MRKQWPEEVRSKALIQSKRICALCFYFSGDAGLKLRGQIAHVDRDARNSTLENAAYLCKDHHDEYDIRSQQSQRISEAELREARTRVQEYIQAGGFPSAKLKSGRKRRGVSLAVYERRLPIYTTTIEFIRYVVADLNPQYPEIFKFGHETEQALFLFDEQVAEYLRLLSNKAVRLHALLKMREAAIRFNRDLGNVEAWVNEETALATWFTEQYDETRRMLSPFLRLE